MNTAKAHSLSVKELKAIESQVQQQLAKILPKVVKNVLHDSDNIAAGIVIQNGVKQPAVNEPAFMVWKAFSIWKNQAIEPTPLLARKLAHELHQASNVVVTDLYLWRKFHGMVK